MLSSHVRLTAALLSLLAAAPAAPAAPRAIPDWSKPENRCPSPFGAEDQRGMMNLQTAATIQAAARLVVRGESFELGRHLPPKVTTGRNFILSPKPGSAPAGVTGRVGNEELIVSELGQIGTNFDAFVHAGLAGSYYNCFTHAQVSGRRGFTKLGVEKVGTIFTRGVLIDVAALKGVAMLPDKYEISVADLKAALKRQKLSLRPGDAVLIRTGRGGIFDRDPGRYAEDTPGIREAAGLWLADRRPVLLGADNSAVERFVLAEAQDPQGISLPVHQITLVARGIHMLENLDLEALGAAKAWEFLFVLQPLKIDGGTGSTVAPTAIR